MNYEKIYTDFYSKYYTKTEFLITAVLTKRKNQNKSFHTAFNEVMNYSQTVFYPKYSLSKNKELENLYQVFRKRSSHYTLNAIQGIFENEIKTEFDKIKVSELPPNYNYIKFIKTIALLEQENEILRLLSVNAELLKMQYELNAFEDFEIRPYDFILENHPNYKKSLSKLHPENYRNSIEHGNSEVLESKVIVLEKLDYNPNHWSKKTFDLFNFLVENYEKKGKIKFVNIYKFLRNFEPNTYSMSFIHDTYKSYIEEKHNVKLSKMKVAEHDYEAKELPILKNFEELFRKSFK